MEDIQTWQQITISLAGIIVVPMITWLKNLLQKTSLADAPWFYAIVATVTIGATAYGAIKLTGAPMEGQVFWSFVLGFVAAKLPEFTHAVVKTVKQINAGNGGQ